MIEAYHINKSFEGEPVLHDISVKFEPGMCNMIIGQSGSGKTVLMKCLVGLHSVDSGKVMFDGREFTAMTFDEKKVIRQEIGMLFQGGALFDSLTVEENVMFPLNMFTQQPLGEKKDRVQFCLQRVALPNATHLYPSELSGGMKKRVAIARAISMNPKYLFCDEPNSGLDPLTAIVIDNLIREITREYNMTTVVNTHDMNSIMEIGDKIAFIYKGKLAWEGDKDKILHTDNELLNDFVFSNTLLKSQKRRP